jgi:quinolinate synthetase A subunit
MNIVVDKAGIAQEILELKKKRNAIILAHYYQVDEVQEIADFIGDSLALAQAAEKTNADIIVFAGVHFMAETAKIICPEKKVLLPPVMASRRRRASCSREASAPASFSTAARSGGGSPSDERFASRHSAHFLCSRSKGMSTSGSATPCGRI